MTVTSAQLAVTIVVMFAFASQLCVCDYVSVRNALTNKTEKPKAVFFWEAWPYGGEYIENGGEKTFYLPEGWFSSEHGVFGNAWTDSYSYSTVVYNSFYDHTVCRNSCTVEMRDDGSYRWNKQNNTWYKVY